MTLPATTMELSLLLAIIGVGGVVSMSLGFPILAIILRLFAEISRSPQKSESANKLAELTAPERTQDPKVSIEIIIPAHNEAANIGFDFSLNQGRL